MIGISVPALTRVRVWFALGVAIGVDLVQLSLGPFGWLWVDEGLDVAAMILISAALGFHMLLLPTFVMEFIPLVDMLPTWTGCTAAVIMLRKRAQAQTPPTSAAPSSPHIDVEAEVIQVPPKI
jgi:hypothetical protein